MRTELHVKLEKYCRIKRDGSKHWVLVDKKIVRLPGGEVVTVRRAIYALNVGPIDEGEEVYAGCGVIDCVAPEHAFKRPSKNGSRALDLSRYSEGESREVVKFDRQVLPKGVSAKSVAAAKHLKSCGFSVSHTARETGLSPTDVVAAHNGAYDGAVERSTSHRAASSTVEFVPPPPRRTFDDENMTEEEKAWLTTVGRG